MCEWVVCGQIQIRRHYRPKYSPREVDPQWHFKTPNHRHRRYPGRRLVGRSLELFDISFPGSIHAVPYLPLEMDCEPDQHNQRSAEWRSETTAIAMQPRHKSTMGIALVCMAEGRTACGRCIQMEFAGSITYTLFGEWWVLD